MHELRASIIVSSYNYEKFLPIAIDSALGQSYPNTEVIVVDDGSRDASPEVIRSYGDRVIPLIKPNGGQASAFNEGFRLSRGEVVVFLDSDDYLEPDTITQAVEILRDSAVSKVHWDLWIADVEGRVSDKTVRSRLSEGHLRDIVLQKGADGYAWPPTSGNGWSRRYLEKAFPIPEAEFVTCPDLYLATLAPLYGQVKAIQTPQGYWRHHPVNASFRDPFELNLQGGLRRAERALNDLQAHAESLGLSVDPEELRSYSRWHQMDSAFEQIVATVAPGEAFILVDEDHWNAGKAIAGRPRFHFVEKDGNYWGMPGEDTMAIAELERLRHEGARYLVIPWPYGWWLEHYAGWNQHLRSRYRVARENDRIVIFDLRD